MKATSYVSLAVFAASACAAAPLASAVDLSAKTGVSLGLDLAGIEIGADSETSLDTQFDAFDKDDNGAVSKSEAQTNAQLASIHGALDIDGNGQLSMAEYTNGLKAKGEGRFNSYVASSSDASTEAKTRAKSRIQAGADAFGEARSAGEARVRSGADAAVSAGTSARSSAESRTRSSANQASSASADTAASVQARTAAAANVGVELSSKLQSQFSGLDRNNDGVLTKSEASADADISSEFAAQDENGDGFLNKTEFKAAAKANAGFTGWLRGLFG